MRTDQNLYLSLLMFLLSGMVTSMTVAAEKPVILTTHNLCPYGCFDNNKSADVNADESFHGLAVDAVRCVFNKLEVPFKIEVLPWARAQLRVKNGSADGFFAASQRDVRDDFAVMSEIIAEQKWKWYLLKDNPLDPTSANFKAEATVGSFIGANMLKWLEVNGYQVAIQPIDTDTLLQTLLIGRVDAVLANNYVMEALLVKYGVEDKVKSFINKNKPLGVYFSKAFLKTNPGFLNQFNQHVAKCR